MSTRWYPLFQPGNPQLRVFLPNFWMKLVRSRLPDDPRPIHPNRVRFIVSMEMTRFDIKNYLQKIYNVEALHVRTEVRMGDTKQKDGGMVTKEDDYKIAYVILPEEQSFTFPDIYPQDKMDEKVEESKKNSEMMKESTVKLTERSKLLPDVPGWFA